MYDEERSDRHEPDAPPIFKICCGDRKYLLPPTPYPDREWQKLFLGIVEYNGFNATGSRKYSCFYAI